MSDTETLDAEQTPGAEAPADSSNGAPARKRGLSGMVLAELRELAAELNIGDTTGMRKGELITAIKDRQGAGSAPKSRGTASTASTAAAPVELDGGQLRLDGSDDQRGDEPRAAQAPAESAPPAEAAADTEAAPPRRRRRTASRPAGAPDPIEGGPADGEVVAAPSIADEPGVDSGPADQSPADPTAADHGPTDQGGGDQGGEQRQGRNRDRQRGGNRNEGGRNEGGRNEGGRNDGGNKQRNDDRQDGGNDGGNKQRNDRNDQQRNQQRNEGGNNRADRADRADDRDDDDDEEGGGRRRGRRFRDRNRRGRDRQGGGREQGGNVDTDVRDDDVLIPVAGILDVLDNYAFVRTTGYLAGPDDVYVSLSMVRRHGLRRGDAVTGMVRQPRDGEQQRQKFNPLVRVDTINGLDPEQAKARPEFTKLTPLYPNDRMRLETEPHKLTTRVIDLVMPVGKGQRALIVSPPKAGKTMVLQSIANGITTNHPECHLMVVLVDERPEEVTDMQRSVKGEVIASTFDRPPSDHTTVAELAIERAKRLVEMGMDVVVLLDSITRLGRAYNLAAPASGRILSGGVDSTALYPPKRFLGAARNIEDGGSLTIFATALVETGSTMDTVIFEEFKGTGNAELKLDRKIADKRVFPAVDVDASSTRKEELLLSPDELAVTVKLRRVLAALEGQQALDLVLTQLRKTRTNIEFLMQVAKNSPSVDDRD